ncbi:MAG: HD domain-containing protein [Patescibacteria group bacterium]|nr:HD domain-containing protein [Patescibacteria group bacterium]
MKNILKFLIDIGKLKSVLRKGITFYGVKNPDSAIDHSFRMAMMIWLFGKEKKINIEKSLKIALIHDMCKVLTGDITPYDGLLPKNKKERDKFVRRWRRLSLREKEKRHIQKFKKEYNALEKLISKLPSKIKAELKRLWLDYHRSESLEAKFVSQIDIVENLLEAFEWWGKNKKFPTQPWWEHAEEAIEEPLLLDFLKEIKKEELKKK